MKGAGGYAAGYDANGNMTSRVVEGAAFILSYDAENRLTGVSGATTATYVYDGDGNRVKEKNVYKNLAAGIVVNGSVSTTYPDVVTNGDTKADSGVTNSREFAYSNSTGTQYVQIDLGASYPVNKVIVWHYNGDGRTYHNTKTQVSADGTNWTTVFDSAVSGEYPETLDGKTHSFAQQNVRYVRDYLNGSTANIYNHWVEIDVWGTTTTSYVRDYFEWNGSAQMMTRYYHAGGQQVAVRHGNGTGTDGVVYLLSDHLGSTTITADPVDGDKLSELRYKAWGATRYSLTNTPTDRRYTGQVEENSGGLGLYFYNARWYDPYITQFTQPDSIIPDPYNPLDWNRFAYVRYNPLKYVDPSGNDPCTGVVGTYMPDCGVDGWYGPPLEIWSEAEIAQAIAEFDQFGNLLELLVSIFIEPIDWGLTARDCTTGDCSPLVLLGILPGIPGSIGRQADETVRLLNPPKRANFPWHHLLPKRFRDWFARRSIDIDDHMVSIPKRIHDLIHGKGPRGGAWNSAWEKWMKANPNATPEDIFKQLGVLIREFNLDGKIKRVKK